MLSKLNVQLLRETSGLNQQDFWSRIGVTQSGGSRYEGGHRRMPKPVLHLLRLVYIEKLDLERVRREDVELVEYLRSQEKELYARLRKDAKQWVRAQPLH